MDQLRQLRRFVRVPSGKFPIYLNPEIPFWFVPNSAADAILLDLQKDPARVQGSTLSAKDSSAAELLDVQRLLRSIRFPSPDPYEGRSRLPLQRLSELWFHLTDECNLRCRHCLFQRKPCNPQVLSPIRIWEETETAYRLGCRLICFTGGEPFLYAGFMDLLRRVLSRTDMRAAILTNGTLVALFLREIQAIDTSRLHFQVSLDGPLPIHDGLRGPGAFHRTSASLKVLVRHGIPCSIAMAVNGENFQYMHDIIRIASRLGVRNVHFLWNLRLGGGTDLMPAPVESWAPDLRSCIETARELGISVDNYEAVKTQVFTYPGTRFDLGNACWESLAVGPDGGMYPSPATVGLQHLRGGALESGLETVWTRSPVFQRIRELSLLHIPGTESDPWRFLTGGADLDHCLASMACGGAFTSLEPDPYAPVAQVMASMAVEEACSQLTAPQRPGLILRMGDSVTQCPAGNTVNFTHSNCLLSLGNGSKTALIREFYSERADSTDETLLNPVRYTEDLVRFIPSEALGSRYGCGSPVTEADLRTGEIVLDLGSGTGVECFLAAQAVGSQGRVLGLDMTDAMLRIARNARIHVRESLGYGNVLFVKGLMEDLPLASNTVDVVLSNCVLNLTPNKRKVFQEIFRVLKPGGRMVLSDVVTEEEPPLRIRADHRLAGECIGGALVQHYLFTLLEETGFSNSRVLNRFPYRTVQGHAFYSLTFSAYRPGDSETRAQVALYSGPFRSVTTDSGAVLVRGLPVRLHEDAALDPAMLERAGVLLIDPESGAVTNRTDRSSCACSSPPRSDEDESSFTPSETGCLLCGAPLRYHTIPPERSCSRCGVTKPAGAECERGHFICDLCHVRDPLEVIRNACTRTRETDMLRLMEKIRAHHAFPLHGPEHHAMIPGIILATYKNLGGPVGEQEIVSAIERGSLVPGGACAFLGTCGAATGVGAAFATILKATPVTASRRQAVQELVSSIIARMADRKAARCCRRECNLALKEAARRSPELLPVRLRAEADLSCFQHSLNRECIGPACPLHPGARSDSRRKDIEWGSPHIAAGRPERNR